VEPSVECSSLPSEELSLTDKTDPGCCAGGHEAEAISRLQSTRDADPPDLIVSKVLLDDSAAIGDCGGELAMTVSISANERCMDSISWVIDRMTSMRTLLFDDVPPFCVIQYYN
jgi:hypothetical protein